MRSCTLCAVALLLGPAVADVLDSFAACSLDALLCENEGDEDHFCFLVGQLVGLGQNCALS